jgi:hypothetical protein
VKRKSTSRSRPAPKKATIYQVIIIIIIIVFLFIARVITAYSRQPGIYRIQRLNGPVTIHGKADEPAWEKITILAMVAHRPVFGNKA